MKNVYLIIYINFLLILLKIKIFAYEHKPNNNDISFSL